MHRPEDIYTFLKSAGNLKRIPRAGWVLKGVHDPESVAEHQYRTVVMAAILAPPKYDKQKILLMALFNDIPQSQYGDVIWEHGRTQDKVVVDIKIKEESEIIESLFRLVERDDLKTLAMEYLKQSSPEARFVKELDKIEMVMQALEYEDAVANAQELREFWENANDYVKTPELRAFFEHLKSRSQIRFTRG